MHVVFNWADYSILAVISISALIGFLRGFVKEMLSLIVWGASFFVGFEFCERFSHYFVSHITNDSLRIATAFIILFSGTLIIGSILSYLLANSIVIKNGIKGPDRFLGIIFGLARGLLVIGVLLLLFSISFKEESLWQKESYLVPKFSNMVTWLKTLLPSTLEKSNIT